MACCSKRIIHVCLLALLVCALLLTGCTAPQKEPEAPAATEPPTLSAEVTEPSAPETAAPNKAEPEDLVGKWERACTEVEGDRVETAPGVCTVEIVGDESAGFTISYTDNEFPDWSYSDAQLLIVPAGDMPLFDYNDWMATVDTTLFDTTRYVTLLQDGSLLMANYWTMDGAPMVSHEWFRRAD